MRDETIWSLQGRLALVTGASKGIGLAVVGELAARGAKVVGCARDVTALEGMGDTVVPVAADITTDEGRRVLLERVDVEGVPLDVLVNNAGRNIRKPTLAYAAEDMQTVLDLNFLAAWHLMIGLHDKLRLSDAPSVVNIGSVAADRAVRSSTAAYAASKGALHALTTFLAAEWAPDRIRVNAVAPWYVRTPLAEAVLADPAKRDAILQRTPLGRVGEPEDVARAVAFLAMPASGWITGCCLPVDGGYSALGF